MSLIIFPDTSVLVAIVAYPRDRSGNLTLGGEAIELYKQSAFQFLLCQAVVDELDEVFARDLPKLRPQAISFVQPFVSHLTRWPTADEITAAFPYCADPDDAPIFASAVLARPNIVLSNDFRAFHTPQAKAFFRSYEIEVESLYGLLRRLGHRPISEE